MERRHTITDDNGPESAGHETGAAQTGAAGYFAAPLPQQRLECQRQAGAGTRETYPAAPLDTTWGTNNATLTG